MTPRIDFTAVPAALRAAARQVSARPARVKFGAAAAVAAAAAGLAAAVAGGSAPAAGTVAGSAAAVSHATAPAAHAAPAARHAAPAARHAAPARHARHAAARHAAVRHHAPGRPYLIYDSVTPSQIPAHHAVATYATGGYAVPAAQVAGRRTVLWIDTNGSDPRAQALDVEPGDATPPVAAAWARAKLSADPSALARIYTMRSEWPAVQAAIAALPAHMRAHVRYWIADPTGVPHIVPGSDATQWYWGHSYDISTATPRF